MLSFLTLFALSCKKETESDNFLNEAQKWYLKSTLNSKTSLQSTANAVESITTKYMWNKSRYFTLSDGKEAAGTPIEITLGNKELAKGSYMLLVYKMNNVYNYKIIYDEKNNYFSDNLSSSEIEKTLNTSIKNSATKSLAKSKEMTLTKSGGQGKLMNHQISEEVCIDWYLIETITWPDGQVSVYESYLYTACYTPGGSGSSGSGGTNQTQQIVVDFGQATDILESSSIQFENDTARLKKDVWIFLNAETFDFKSRELIYQVKTAHSGGWVFGGITHDSHYVVGNVYYGDVSIEGFKWEKTQSLQNVSASVEFRTKIVFDTPFGGGTKYGDMEFSIHNWNSW